MDDQGPSEQDSAANMSAANPKENAEPERESAGRSDRSFSRARAAKLFACTSTLVAVGLVVIPLATSARAPRLTPHGQASVSPLLPPKEFQKEAGWRKAIAATPLPGKGCFTTKYPSLKWQAVRCVPAPTYPMQPRSGVVPQIVGNGNDVAAQAPTGHISSATGSFDTLTNVASESGPVGNAGASTADTYTLQVNTDFFTTSACSTSTNTACKGWEQFVFENNTTDHRAYIQYWLTDFGTSCPTNFQAYAVSGHPDCVQRNNLSGAVSTTAVPVTNLGQVTLTGKASAGADSIRMTIGGTAYARGGDNSVNASSGWTIAEFNVLGDGGNGSGGGTATFNNNAALVTRTQIDYGRNAAPNCVAQGFTAEKNNLSFGPLPPPVGSQPGPAVIWNESTAGGAPSACAAGTTVGDAHLTTLSGLLYDFQATGDFELLQSKSGFVVQARQVSGAPTWPNASVNMAIATRVGKTQVAVCLAPQRLFANGQALALSQGNVRLLADGTQILLRGNSYLIRGASGDWVKADVNTNYINVDVGLGQWPIGVQGLLVNANGNPNQLVTRGGTVLRNPFSFKEFYSSYGESWRVKPAQSMLNVCGKRKESGLPAKPFSVKDLPPQTAARARAICVKTGVRENSLLAACMIDVAFTGKAAAARIYATTRPPVAVGVIR
jgi:hypothetical protein